MYFFQKEAAFNLEVLISNMIPVHITLMSECLSGASYRLLEFAVFRLLNEHVLHGSSCWNHWEHIFVAIFSDLANTGNGEA